MREDVYQLDSIDNGNSEILACGPDQCLVLEHDSLAGKKAEYRKLILIDLSKATDIAGTVTLTNEELPETLGAFCYKMRAIARPPDTNRPRTTSLAVHSVGVPKSLSYDAAPWSEIQNLNLPADRWVNSVFRGRVIWQRSMVFSLRNWWMLFVPESGNARSRTSSADRRWGIRLSWWTFVKRANSTVPEFQARDILVKA